MESQQQQQHEESNIINNGGGGVSKSSFLCRQSSTRWIPTTDQIRILRDLYYNNGVRSPSAEQIQRISARLRQYGKIEGKNVFYWFQNHKARERQKKRLTLDLPNTKYTTNMPPGVSATFSSPGFYGVGQIGGSTTGCGGSVLMERNYREFCTPGGGDYSAMESNSSIGWVGLETSTRPNIYQYTGQEAPPHAPREIETLPLFPIHSTQEEEEEEEEEEQEEQEEEQEQEQEQEEQGGHEEHGTCSHLNSWAGNPHQLNGNYFPAFYWGGDEQDHHHHYNNHYNNNNNNNNSNSNAPRTSLELTLNSYCYGPHDP